jgi:hypothetical protein
MNTKAKQSPDLLCPLFTVGQLAAGSKRPGENMFNSVRTQISDSYKETVFLV